MSLTTLQELFVRALLSDPKRNATAAAVVAGYSPKRAEKTARELMDDPEVQLALHEKQLAALEWLGWRLCTAGRVYLIRPQQDGCNVGNSICDFRVHSPSLHL